MDLLKTALKTFKQKAIGRYKARFYNLYQRPHCLRPELGGMEQGMDIHPGIKDEDHLADFAVAAALEEM